MHNFKALGRKLTGSGRNHGVLTVECRALYTNWTNLSLNFLQNWVDLISVNFTLVLQLDDFKRIIQTEPQCFIV